MMEKDSLVQFVPHSSLGVSDHSVSENFRMMVKHNVAECFAHFFNEHNDMIVFTLKMAFYHVL